MQKKPHLIDFAMPHLASIPHLRKIILRLWIFTTVLKTIGLAKQGISLLLQYPEVAHTVNAQWVKNVLIFMIGNALFAYVLARWGKYEKENKKPPVEDFSEK